MTHRHLPRNWQTEARIVLVATSKVNNLLYDSGMCTWRSPGSDLPHRLLPTRSLWVVGMDLDGADHGPSEVL